MIAFLVTGLVLGVITRTVRGGLGAPQLFVTCLAGVTGALVGGMSSNRMVGQDLGDLGVVSFLASVGVGIAAIALVEHNARSGPAS